MDDTIDADCSVEGEQYIYDYCFDRAYDACPGDADCKDRVYRSCIIGKHGISEETWDNMWANIDACTEE